MTRGLYHDESGSPGICYYVELLYSNNDARDSSYGREFKGPIIVIGGPDMPRVIYEVLYRKKGNIPTGKKNWRGRMEQLPAVEMVIKVANEPDLESLLASQNSRVAVKKEIRQATMAFTVISSSKGKLESFTEEFKALVGGMCEGCIEQKISGIRSNKDAYNREGAPHYADFFAIGPVDKILYAYEFVEKRDLNYENIGLTFG